MKASAAANTLKITREGAGFEESSGAMERRLATKFAHVDTKSVKTHTSFILGALRESPVWQL